MYLIHHWNLFVHQYYIIVFKFSCSLAKYVVNLVLKTVIFKGELLVFFKTSKASPLMYSLQELNKKLFSCSYYLKSHFTASVGAIKKPLSTKLLLISTSPPIEKLLLK